MPLSAFLTNYRISFPQLASGLRGFCLCRASLCRHAAAHGDDLSDRLLEGLRGRRCFKPSILGEILGVNDTEPLYSRIEEQNLADLLEEMFFSPVPDLTLFGAPMRRKMSCKPNSAPYGLVAVRPKASPWPTGPTKIPRKGTPTIGPPSYPRDQGASGPSSAGTVSHRRGVSHQHFSGTGVL